MSKRDKSPGTPKDKPMTAAQRAYEERRAGKAGLSLDKHLAAKQRRAHEAVQSAAPPAPPKKPGVMSRLLERARRPM